MNDPELQVLVLRRILVGVLVALNCLFGAFNVFVLIVFFGNFRFDDPLHLLIFGMTLLHPMSAIWTGILCFREPTRFRTFLLLMSGALFWLIVKMYDLPGARGLIH